MIILNIGLAKMFVWAFPYDVTGKTQMNFLVKPDPSQTHRNTIFTGVLLENLDMMEPVGVLC